jgi:hypothetical protein
METAQIERKRSLQFGWRQKPGVGREGRSLDPPRGKLIGASVGALLLKFAPMPASAFPQRPKSTGLSLKADRFRFASMAAPEDGRGAQVSFCACPAPLETPTAKGGALFHGAPRIRGAPWKRRPTNRMVQNIGRLLAVLMLLVGQLAPAQDSLRNSLAGDAAAAALRQQQANELYTIKEGDFRLLAVPWFEADWNDNVNLSKTDRESDFILEPFLQLTGSYPLTQHNLLRLSIGVGYADYLRHSEDSGLRVASDSQLSFDMFIKDFAFNFHDRFSVSEDASTEPAVSGTALYGSFNNTVGLTTTWDREDVVLSLGYDHQNSISTTGQFSYLNRSSELPVARAGLHLRPDLTAGVEVSAGFTTYDQAVLNNNQSYSGGVYGDWTPSPGLRVQPRLGYTIYQFQHTSQSDQIYYFGYTNSAPSIQTSDLNAWYADLTVAHQVTKAVSYGFSAGHEVRLGIESDVVEDYYVRPNINWAVFKDVGLTTFLTYERGNQGVGNYYGGGLNVSYQLMKRLLLGFTYRLTFRSSNLLAGEYSQNMLGLRLSYQLP